MDGRILIFLLRAGLLALVLIILSGCGGNKLTQVVDDEEAAVINPEVARRNVDPPKIDTDDFEISAFAGMMSVEDFETGLVYGARLDYHVSERLFVEGSYGQTNVGETSYERLSGGTPLLTDDQRNLRYYDLALGYSILPGESFIGGSRAFNSALYFIAGVGNTDFADDSYFTVMFGAGYRMLLMSSMALHFDFRDHMFDTDLLGESKTTHNVEFTLGLSVFF
jgi:outer membrane beta-barrel protein